ncbi:MAG: cyclic nucleotide-binding domain-containing protein [Thermincola sp.]|nr:cyclic nucleotide-binding domain-containing protein [Thermincola sp.]MDT3702293.1 cyclic nucleotide-binding domain-containing protein [Thermincola sp.]
MNDKVFFLSKVKVLSELTLQELTELAEDFEWAEYPKDTEIIRQGQLKQRFSVLISGKAKAQVLKKNNAVIQVESFIPGDFFGDIGIITGRPANASVITTEDCSVLTIAPKNFNNMLLRWPKLYMTFLDNLSTELSIVRDDLWAARQKEFLRAGLQFNQFENKFYGIWGSRKTTKEVENRLAQLSRTKEHLLLIGERGTGRQMIAWYLHKQQFSDTAPFIVIDGQQFDQQWGDLPYKTKGPEQTTANFRNSSVLEIAEGGTLFIREINLLSPRAQLHLAEALQSEVSPCRIVGSLKAEPEMLSERLIPQLQECFTQTYKIAPLRERKRDIPVLVEGFLKKLALRNNRNAPELNHEATKLLLGHDYRQGNVTELIQVIERAFFLTDGDVIRLEHIFFGPTAEKTKRSINMLSWSLLEKLIKKGVLPLWPQHIMGFSLIASIFWQLLAPSSAIAGFMCLVVWSLWWPTLTVLSPPFGRFWCAICPVSYVMERAQKILHLDRPVPDFLKKYNYLFFTVLFLFVFWIEFITGMRFNPVYTGLWLLAIVGTAVIIGIIYTRHTWCRHLCPLGAFVGMASIGGMVEVRSDPAVCLNKCTTYECYRGTKNIMGCPLSMHAPYVDNNLDCKLCLRCARNCPNGSVKFNFRVPAQEVWHLVRVNQGFVVFIGVSLATLLPIYYFQTFRSAWPPNEWRLYFSLFYWGTAAIAGAITWLIARPYKTKGASRRIRLFFSFIPLILSGYVVYQLHYLPGINSVLLGLGFKTGEGVVLPFYVSLLAAAQVMAVAFGLAITVFTVIMVLLRSKDKSTSDTQHLS